MNYTRMKQYLFMIVAFSFCTNMEAQEMVFSPQWKAQSQFAGFYAAEFLGYYKEEGLDVKIQHQPISQSPLLAIKNEKCQLITSNLLQVIHFNSINKDPNKDLINIMQISQNNNCMLVSRYPLKGINSLKNKTVAVWSYIDDELLKSINAITGLNIKWIKFNGGVNILLSKAVDIILVTKANEYHLIAESGQSIKPNQIIKFADTYNIPEEGVYVTREYYIKNKEALAKFVKATKRGWEWAAENKKEAVDIVMQFAFKYNLGINRYHQRMMLDDILQLITDQDSNKRTYKLSESGYNCAIDFLSIKDTTNFLKYYDFVK